MKSFWSDLKQPFTVLAPMDGVTDFVFRQIVTEVGKPDVLFTEFVNVEGLNSAGYDRVVESLKFEPTQNPVVAQLWGKDLKAYEESAKLCREMGFMGIDINTGCPDRTIVKSGCCAALIKNPKLTEEIIEAVRRGAGDLPVSVKTRIGYSEIDMGWIEFLLKQNLPALTIHLRTASELSKVDAHWELMSTIIELRNKISPETLIIGNGDLKTLREIDEKYELYNCDGFMVGRGIFSNPWMFDPSVDIENVSIEKRIALFEKHIKLYEKTFPNKNPAFLKKFCKTYIQNFPDAVELREKIMECVTLEQMKKVLSTYSV